MLRTLHRFRIFFLAFLCVASIALAMSGFAYQWMAPQRNSAAAIRIDDSELTYEDVNNERQELDRLYRAQFGFNYHKVLESAGLSIQQQAVDRAVQSAIMDKEARALGFGAGKNSVRAQLEKELAGSPNPADQYRMLLREMNMTAQEFESRLSKDLVRSQLEQAVRDASISSEKETAAAVLQQKTTASVDYLALTPDNFLGEIKDPSEEAIKQHYDDNASDFEIPARVSYSYAVLSPDKFLDIVEVFPDDVEIYYTDHQSEYMLPEKRSVRMIELKENVAAAKKTSAKGDKKAAAKEEAPKAPSDELKKQAEGLVASLKSGGVFADLAKANSKDASAAKGGEIGTFTRAELVTKFGEEAAKAVFALEAGKSSESLVEGASIRIFSVDTITPEKAKELAEVRPEIETIIRKREAPAFTAAKSAELLDAWKAASKPLSDFVTIGDLASRALVAVPAAGLQDKSIDPTGLVGLTERVLDQVDEKQQLVDLGDKFVLVEVAQSKEPEVQPLDSVKERIVALLKRREAGNQAKAMAQSIVDEMKAGKYKDLKSAAASAGQKLESLASLSRAQPAAPFNQGELRSELFSAQTAMAAPSRVITKDGTYYVFQVTKLETPTVTDIQKEVIEARERESQELARLVLTSLLNERKAQAKIDIEPNLLASR
jgi:peptidyl-prolyl cis-trans isomerase D